MKRANAAVMVLHEQATNSIILTKRSDGLRNHPGEVCFPGGRWDEQDDSLYTTALRELTEELGINKSRVTLKQALKTEQTLTGYTIYPWLAAIDTLEPFVINKQEVQTVLRISMVDVGNINNYQAIEVGRSGMLFSTYHFTANNHFVWGATAKIMMQLCDYEFLG